jgi:hypothetical protein
MNEPEVEVRHGLAESPLNDRERRRDVQADASLDVDPHRSELGEKHAITGFR